MDVIQSKLIGCSLLLPSSCSPLLPSCSPLLSSSHLLFSPPLLSSPSLLLFPPSLLSFAAQALLLPGPEGSRLRTLASITGASLTAVSGERRRRRRRRRSCLSVSEQMASLSELRTSRPLKAPWLSSISGSRFAPLLPPSFPLHFPHLLSPPSPDLFSLFLLAALRCNTLHFSHLSPSPCT
eukprot:630955-Hanusia_phi.AAC.2